MRRSRSVSGPSPTRARRAPGTVPSSSGQARSRMSWPFWRQMPAHADGERSVGREGGGQRQFGAGPGPVLSGVRSAGAEVVQVHAVADHRPAGGDALGLPRAAFGLADAEHPVGPTGPVPLPAQGERGGGPADRVEGPGVGLEDGGHGAAHGEPPGQSGLGAVGVQQVGADVAEQPPGADDLGGQPGPGGPPGTPGEHLGAGRPGGVAERAAAAGSRRRCAGLRRSVRGRGR